MNPKTEIKIFIGYAREDQQYAEHIYRFLQSIKGVVPWLDKSNLLPGANWEEEIMTAIAQSRFVIMLLSSRSVNKEGYVQKEVAEVLDRLKHFPPGEIFIIPVRIDYCTPRYRALKKLHWVDLFESSVEESSREESGMDRGLSKIKRLISIEQNKLFHQNHQEMNHSSHSNQQDLQKQAKKTSHQLSDDLLDNLSQYVKWLYYQEYLPAKGQYEQIVKLLPNWTRQANGNWLEELLTCEVLMLQQGCMVFTPLGIELLTIIQPDEEELGSESML